MGNLVKLLALGLKVRHLQLLRLQTISNNGRVVKYRTFVTWVLGVNDLTVPSIHWFTYTCGSPS